MENTLTIFDIVSLSYKGQSVRGVIMDKDIDFEEDVAIPTSEVLLEPDGEYIKFPDSALTAEGKLHTPFTWRDVVHVVPDADESQRFYGRVSGISWSPESNTWYFAVMPMQGGDVEMFSERELTPVSLFDFAK